MSWYRRANDRLEVAETVDLPGGVRLDRPGLGQQGWVWFDTYEQAIAGLFVNASATPTQTMTMTPMEAAATSSGGKKTFSVSSLMVPVAQTVTGADGKPICAFVNPVDSGVDIRLARGEFSASEDTRFRRYSGPASMVVVAQGKTGRIPRNAAGGSTQSPARMYVNPDYTIDATKAEETKAAHIAAYITYYPPSFGGLVVPPGRAMAWTMEGRGVGMTGTISLEWWESPVTT